MRKTVTIIALASVGCVVGCSEPTGPRVVANPDLSVKIPSIKEGARTRDRSEINAMIDQLDSDDPAVRFYAVEGLRRATNQTLGYRYYDDEEQRKAAVARWKKWRDETGH
jgi:hypothetical protein